MCRGHSTPCAPSNASTGARAFVQQLPHRRYSQLRRNISLLSLGPVKSLALFSRRKRIVIPAGPFASSIGVTNR